MTEAMSVKTIIRHLLTGLAFLVAYVALDYVSYVKPYRDVGITPWNRQRSCDRTRLPRGLPIVPFVLVAPFIADIIVRQIPIPLDVDATGSFLVGSTFVPRASACGASPTSIRASGRCATCSHSW